MLEAQANAGVEVPDARVEKMIEELTADFAAPYEAVLPVEEQVASSSATPSESLGNQLEKFLTQSAQLESQFKEALPHFNASTTSPALFLEQITVSPFLIAPLLIPLPNFQQSVQSERTSLSQIERLASAISLPQPNTLAETVRLLQSHMAHRERRPHPFHVGPLHESLLG